MARPYGRDRAPIHHWFEITTTPLGGAPLAMREQWVGVVLPVRRPRPVEGPEPWAGREIGTGRIVTVDDGVIVEIGDALRVLELFGRDEAAAWWRELGRRQPVPGLGFRWNEGRWLPTDLVYARHPVLEELDDR
jgi:hypothetical protein